MKVMIRKLKDDKMVAYVPKKDLEEPIVETEKEGFWGGNITLANGWILQLPAMPPETAFPITVEAKKL